MITAALACQLALLVYHQVTTRFDFFPFNSARHYTRKEKLAEAGVNFVLMGLGPIGFGFHIKGLMNFGVVYYFILFGIELIIWWVPYLTVPSGWWGEIYKRVLGAVMFNDPKADALTRWQEIYNRLHRHTIAILPPIGDRPRPNLEHTILHAWTLVTALVTAWAWHAR
jgi:hypothetical protein